MNAYRKGLLTALLASLLPMMASAAVDMFLQIKDGKGVARVVHCPAGACLVDGLAPGKYSVLICDAQGKVIPTTTRLEYEVRSPRDLASGQASGKRMHKPIAITMELGRSVGTAGTPAANEIAIDESGVHVAIGVSPEAVDAALAKIGKTRSNIQNN